MVQKNSSFTLLALPYCLAFLSFQNLDYIAIIFEIK